MVKLMKCFQILLLLIIPILLSAQTGPGGVSPNLTLWFKGNAGTTVAGNSLTNWSDQSGNPFHITQGSATNQPLLEQNHINFNPAVVFDGGSDYLPISTKNYTGVGALSALTTFVVFKSDFVGGGYNGNWSFLDFDRSDFFNMYMHGDNGNVSFSYRSGSTTYDNDGLTTGFNDGLPHLGMVGYNNSVVNETTIRVDGVEDLAVNRVANGATIGLASTRYGFIGDGSEATTADGTRNNIYYNGSIAEVIYFERSLNATELNRVESYLAIKYGLTLGSNVSPISYTTSNGTVIWTGSTTYQNGIAGVGRDDNSLLSQLKSSAVNSNVITIERAAPFTVNLTFLVWGHDNAGNGLTSTNLPSGYSRRLQNTWLAQTTGTPGASTLNFIISNTGFNSYLAEDYTLLIDDNGDFTSGFTPISASSIVGDTVKFSSVTLNSGDYFTIAGPNARTPGGQGSGLSLWYRANVGIDTNAGVVASWKDNSAQTNHATQSSFSARPTYLSGTFNYNPSISFDDVNDYLPITKINYAGAASLSQVLTFIIYKTTVTGGTNDNWAFLDFDRSEYFNFSIKGNGGLRFSYTSAGTTYDLDGATNNLNNGLARLGAAYYNNTLTSETEIRTGGRRDHLSNNVVNGATLGTALTRYGIIGDGSEAASFNSSTNGNYYGGEIAEIIYYSNQSFAPNQIQIIESYLAVKYGLVLSKNNNGNVTSLESPNSDGVHEGDYLSSSGAVIWDASVNNGYDNELVGIGRDDATGLMQKQSHCEDDSLRMYLQSLQPSNTLNSAMKSHFGSNEGYLLIGHNGAPQYESGPLYGQWPVGVYSRIDRVWKIQNTNFSGMFSLDITLNPLSDISAVNPNDLVLLIDADGIFTDANTYGTADGLTISISANTVTFSGVTTGMVPTNGVRYLTIGVTNPGVSLPIELLSFSGEFINSSVLLTWHVASEINNDFFTIEKSIDGQTWIEIGMVDGAGDSDNEIMYQFKDIHPNTGISYYRMKQTDFDGRFEYFKPIFLESKGNNLVSVYPNPTNNTLNIDSFNESLVIFIYDLSGNKVLQQIFTQNHNELDTSQLKNGIYILTINQRRYTIRVYH